MLEYEQHGNFPWLKFPLVLELKAPFAHQKDEMSRSNVLVIGATSGVGKSVLQRLLEEDYYIFTLSRRELLTQSENHCHFQCDITDYSSLRGVFDKISRLDFIINCVGVGFYSPVEENFSIYWKQIIETNVLGLINLISCCHQFEFPIRHFVHVGSLAAYRASRTVGNAVYSSTKTAALPILAEFRRSLKTQKRKTKLTLISPGFIEGTEFGEHYFSSSPSRSIDIYSEFKGLCPNDVAESIMYSLNSPENVEIREIVLCSTEQPD